MKKKHKKRTLINKQKNLLTFRRDKLNRVVIAKGPGCNVRRKEYRRSDMMQHGQTSQRSHSINK